MSPQLLQDLNSDTQFIRGKAMESLLAEVKTDPSICNEALPLFQDAVTAARDCWTALNAARGIEVVLGPEGARSAWVSLLHHPDEQTVINAADELSDPSYLPELQALIARRNEQRVRGAALRSMARTKAPSVYAILIESLSNKDMRSDAIQALGDYGDPLAIPHLKCYFTDKTDSNVHIEQGRRYPIGALAQFAVQNLQPLVTSQNKAANIPPLPTQKANPSRLTLAAYAPLAAAVLSLPWTFLIIVIMMANQSSAGVPRSAVHTLDVLGMVPAVLGLLIGTVAIFYWRSLGIAKVICLLLGTAGCVPFIVMYVSELMH